MDTFYLVSILLLGLMLIYLLIKNQVVKMVEERLHSMYREKIESDVQDIYREFESYSAIIDSRIQRLKTLTERQENAVKAWETIQSDLKKAKAGKELLNYLEEKQKTPELDAETLAQLKKEIIADLKTYLAQKLTPGAENNKPRATTISTPVASSIKEEKKIPGKKVEPEEFNVAEMIIDEMVARAPVEIAGKSPRRQNTLSPIKFQAPANPEPGKEQGGFFNIMASLGRALSPMFMKPAGESSLGDGNIYKSASPAGNFNDLIKKEIKTNRPANQAVVPEKPVEKIPDQPAEKISLKTSLDPAELIRLIDDLKNSKTRPTALKNLVSRGFDLNQIAELSSIPYSDLELTKNLYRI